MCYFERTLNIHPPFVVSVAVLIINIPKSRAVTLGTLRFNDAEGNEEVKKTIVLISKTTT